MLNDVMRFTIIDPNGGVSFVAPCRTMEALVAGCAAIMIAPWMIKDAGWLQNPVSPFLNSVFPNPYIHVSFERDYAAMMRHYEGLKSNSQIPLEVTVRGGALSGLKLVELP